LACGQWQTEWNLHLAGSQPDANFAKKSGYHIANMLGQHVLKLSMNRHYEFFKTWSSPSTEKTLLNHTIYTPSQTGETVPLNW
jgi:hypothetical protein